MDLDVTDKVSDVCASPICGNVVEPGRPDKLYCGDKCRQAMSLIKRTGALYGLSAETVQQALEIISRDPQAEWRMSAPDMPAYYVCRECDEVVHGDHVHNVWRLSHPLVIEQRSTAGMDLEPITLCVVIYAGWVDMGMRDIYHPWCRPYRPSVGLS